MEKLNTVGAPRQQSLRAVLLGGLLPLVVYTFVEEYYGVVWGLVCGMVLGVGEIVWEKVREKKVSSITWIGNGMLLGLGSISLVTQEGIWFKLQPALLEFATAVLFIGSVVINRPFLVLLAEKQNLFARMPPERARLMASSYRGFTFRLGIFFLAHSLIATYAAVYWSTRAWIFLKGVGLTGTLILYALAEAFMLRRRLSRASLPQG